MVVRSQPTISYYIPESQRYLTDLASLSTEQCVFIALDSSLAITSSTTISSQLSTQVSIDVRSVLLEILDPLTTSLLLIHNHPSGTVYPSKADYHSTNQIIMLGELLHFKLIDHVIVTKNNYFSFAESGILSDIKNQSV